MRNFLPAGFRIPKWIGSLLAIAVILVGSWLVVESPLFHKTVPQQTVAQPGARSSSSSPTAVVSHLTDLQSLKQFQELFNADAGLPRLVVIVSPT